MASKEKKKNGLEIYKSKNEFRWRIYRQGRIIAASTEGYKRLAGVVKNLESINDNTSTYLTDCAITAYKFGEWRTNK